MEKYVQIKEEKKKPKKQGKKKSSPADNERMKREVKLLLFLRRRVNDFWTSGITMHFLWYRTVSKYKGYIYADSLTCFWLSKVL